MSKLFQKMNLKDQSTIVVLNAPASFETELAALQDVTDARELKAVKEVEFSLAFVTKQAEVDKFAQAIAKKSKAMRWCGSLIRKARQKSISANSTATTAGPCWANWALNLCGW